MQIESLEKHFLVAMPVINDPTFSKSVVYINEQTDEGTMGLVINKSLHIPLGNVLRHLDIEAKDEEIDQQPVYMGGPVQQEQGFVIHDNYLSISDDEPDDQEIAISISKEMLQMIADGSGPRHYLVALGYASWEPGQLEAEISRNDWLVAPFDAKILFTTPLEERWRAAAKLIGVDINRLTDQVGHA